MKICCKKKFAVEPESNELLLIMKECTLGFSIIFLMNAAHDRAITLPGMDSGVSV